MRLVVLYKCTNSTVGKTTGTGTFGTDNFISNIIISSCSKTLKTDLFREICTCVTSAKFFLPNTHPHNWFMLATAQLEKICSYKQLEFYLEMHRGYARKSQYGTNINQFTLKTLTRGEWPSGLRRCKRIGKFLVQTLAQPGLETQSRYKGPDVLWDGTWIKSVINIGWITLSFR